MTTNITTLNDGTVKIDFEKTDGVHTLRDAIHLPQAEYDAMTPDQIDTMAQQRFDNWIAIITAPPADVPVDEQPQE